MEPRLVGDVIWQTHVAEKNWKQANEYCGGLDEGQRHWRLPTLFELQRRFPKESSAYAINPKDPSVWSSTIPEGIEDDALLLDIISGKSHHRDKTYGGYVICVAND